MDLYPSVDNSAILNTCIYSLVLVLIPMGMLLILALAVCTFTTPYDNKFALELCHNLITYDLIWGNTLVNC